MKRLALLFALFASTSHATYLKPWFLTDLQPQIQLDYTFENYRRINMQPNTIRRVGTNHFLHGSVSLAALDLFSLEIELQGLHTDFTQGAFDYGSLTARYHLANDLEGDPFSAIAGITIRLPTHRAIHDFNALHHGFVEVEAHLSLGREVSCYETWTSRTWSVLGVGWTIARGYPWLFLHGGVEANLCDRAEAGLLFRCEQGLGFGDLTNLNNFPGYSKIHYTTVDVGAVLEIVTDWNGSRFFVEALYRAYGQNVPTEMFRGVVGYRYALSL